MTRLNKTRLWAALYHLVALSLIWALSSRPAIFWWGVSFYLVGTLYGMYTSRFKRS